MVQSLIGSILQATGTMLPLLTASFVMKRMLHLNSLSNAILKFSLLCFSVLIVLNILMKYYGAKFFILGCDDLERFIIYTSVVMLGIIQVISPSKPLEEHDLEIIKKIVNFVTSIF